MHTMVLPPFDAYGLLPPGDYPLTLPELKQSMLVNGPAPAHEPWDAPWRAHLVDNLGVLGGCPRISASGFWQPWFGMSIACPAGAQPLPSPCLCKAMAALRHYGALTRGL